VIVAASVTDEQNDLAQLHPMIEATATSLAEAGIDDRPNKLLADAGYCSEENLAALGDEDPDVYVATRNMKKNQTPRTGRRGPLKQGATLVEKMDRTVGPTEVDKLTCSTGSASTSSNPSSDRSRMGATSAASCDEAKPHQPPSGSSSAGPTTS
jgi:hypothetical protein